MFAVQANDYSAGRLRFTVQLMFAVQANVYSAARLMFTVQANVCSAG